MFKHPLTGEIWTNEHGPRGGDDINIISSGKIMVGQKLHMVLIIVVLP